MADADTEVTLEALHDAMKSQVAAAFTSFRTVECYLDDESEGMPTPACLIEMTEAEPAPEMDAGTGQWPAYVRFDLRIIMAHRSGATRLEIRKAATALATWLYNRRFTGIAMDPCQVIACEPDEFAPNLDKFAVWRVEIVALVMLGESAWNNDGVVPTEVLYSWSPNIGFGHEGDYTPTGIPNP